MRAIVVHNRYRSNQPSGETRVVDEDIEELEADGVAVHAFVRSSDEIEQMNLVQRSLLGLRPTASPMEMWGMARTISDFEPDIIHLHNVFPLISPSVIWVANHRGVPIVQTVHNHRHSCPSGIRFRAGAVCTDCVGRRVPISAVRHGCYRNSTLASGAMAMSATVHRSTWQSLAAFLAVSSTVADGLLEIGIPRKLVRVRPNRVAVPDSSPAPKPTGPVTYIGRLEEEKGIRVLLEAWRRVGDDSQHNLVIAGGGSLAGWVADECRYRDDIRFEGLVNQERVNELLAESSLVVVPSLWPEPDPLSLTDALGAGRAVMASRIGSMIDSLDDSSGWLVEPTADGFAHGLRSVLAQPEEIVKRCRGARRKALARQSSYERLAAVYEDVVG